MTVWYLNMLYFQKVCRNSSGLKSFIPILIYSLSRNDYENSTLQQAVLVKGTCDLHSLLGAEVHEKPSS